MILPKNELKVANTTPSNFLIWGQSMSGKTYMAREFESPIIINTDGNASKVDTPSIAVKTFPEFAEAIHALETQKHTFKTLIIDLVDDVEVMLTNYICEQDKVEALADIGFGKGYAKQSSMWKKLMMTLTQMNMTVIFISHSVEKSDDNGQTTYHQPSLSQKGLNACMGRCDLSIQTKKIGSNYIRLCTAKREAYKEEDIKDKKILEILKTLKGVFDTKPLISQVGPAKTVPVKPTPVNTQAVKAETKPTKETEEITEKSTKKEVKIPKITKIEKNSGGNN